MKALLFTIAASFASFSAHAQDALVFKGFQIGAKKEDVVAFFPRPPGMGCGPRGCFWDQVSILRACSNREPACRQNFEYAGALPTLLMIEFKDDALVEVTADLPVHAFDAIAAAMRERFGPPNSDQQSTVQNRAGATFDNRELGWTRGDAVLTLTKRGGMIDESRLHFVGVQYLKEKEDQRAKDAKARAKSL